MSGLEPLAALGLACNIFQLIEVGCNTIKLAKGIYQSSSPAVDQAIQDNAVILSTISDEVRAAQRPASLSKLDKQLGATADKCSSAARDLQEEVRFLLSNAKQNQLAATLKVVAKTTWRRRRLDRLKENLESAEKLMTKTLLAQIWSRTRAAELELSNARQDVRVFIQEYKDGSRDIKQLVSSEGLMTRNHISASSKNTLEAIDEVQKQVNRLTLEADVHIDQAKRERLLRSLKFPAFNDRRNQVSEAHEKTFEWIFVGDDGPSRENLSGSDLEDSDWEDSDLEDLDLADPSEASWDLFSNWLSSTEGIYWISGKPGSGKTTLVKYVLDHSRTATHLNTWSPQSLIISHFLWRPGTPMQRSIKGLLCSLLYQLLDNSVTATDYVLQNIQAERSGTKDEDADWSVLELRLNFLKILHSYERPICIFIDGLDEVDPADGPVELVDLVEEISRCSRAKLCLSSRPELILEERLSAYPHIRLQDLNRPDLLLYARGRVMITRSTDEEVQFASLRDHENLIWSLVEKAEGVFLWLVLAIKSINKGFTFGDTRAMIQQRIDRLPGGLTKLYKDMWARACEDNPVAYRQIAALYFRLILCSQRHDLEGQVFRHPNLVQIMLASTSVADQLLDAINKPSELVPEEKLLQHCRAVERGLKLYCFGLIEVYQLTYKERLLGWYGTWYSTLWYQYGARIPRFVHRTAQDFLLDTVDGSEILSHNSTPEASLFLTWVRAHLATSQLYAGRNSLGFTNVISMVRSYTMLLDHFSKRECFLGNSNWTRTISYLQELCNSGQLLAGWADTSRFCGGIDVFNVTATICDEHLLSRQKISSFSKSATSEILLNFFDRDFEWKRRGFTWPFYNSAESLITTLLSEGANPNWRGTMFHPWEGDIPKFLSGVSEVRTPFTEYLTIMVCLALCKRFIALEQCQIATILRILHAFLSCSANLGDTIHRVFRYSFKHNDHTENYSVFSAMFEVPWGETPAESSFLIVAFSAYSVLKVLLDHLSTEIEQIGPWEEMKYAEMLSLLVRNREYLNTSVEQEHPRVIGRFDYRGAKDSSASEHYPHEEYQWFYGSLEGYSMGIANELMGEMEKYLLDSFNGDCSTRKAGIITHVLRLPWSLQAKGGKEIRDLLIELGILARTDFETHGMEDWVDKFREKLFANRRAVV